MSNRTKYNSKAKDSFKTKFNFYLFKLLIENRKEVDKVEFRTFKLEDETPLIELYLTVYLQYEYDYVIPGAKPRKIKELSVEFEELKVSNQQIQKSIEIEYCKDWKENFSFDEFVKMMESVKECCYCKVSISKLEILAESKKIFKKANRGWTLEVERFDSNLEYTKENCAMACYWCNNAKTDEFTKEEFQPIADQISKVWKARLAQ